MNSYSITQLMTEVKLANNGRLIGLAMTPAMVRAAEKAVARGLLTKSETNFPLYGATAVFSLPE